MAWVGWVAWIAERKESYVNPYHPSNPYLPSNPSNPSKPIPRTIHPIPAMPITITRARIKEKCGVTDTVSDSTIDNLIAEMTPVVEYAIQTGHLADTSLSTTLSLGATEVVCGEFLAQFKRQENALRPADSCGGISRCFDPTDPSRLIAKGWRLLRPYLKVDPPFAVGGGIRTGAVVKPTEEPE